MLHVLQAFSCVDLSARLETQDLYAVYNKTSPDAGIHQDTHLVYTCHAQIYMFFIQFKKIQAEYKPPNYQINPHAFKITALGLLK